LGTIEVCQTLTKAAKEYASLMKQKGLTDDEIEEQIKEIMNSIPHEYRLKWGEKYDKDGNKKEKRSINEILKTLVKGCCNMKKSRTFKRAEESLEVGDTFSKKVKEGLMDLLDP